MKKAYRIVSILLSLTLLFGMMPFTALAESQPAGSAAAVSPETTAAETQTTAAPSETTAAPAATSAPAETTTAPTAQTTTAAVTTAGETTTAAPDAGAMVSAQGETAVVQRTATGFSYTGGYLYGGGAHLILKASAENADYTNIYIDDDGDGALTTEQELQPVDLAALTNGALAYANGGYNLAGVDVAANALNASTAQDLSIQMLGGKVDRLIGFCSLNSSTHLGSAGTLQSITVEMLGGSVVTGVLGTQTVASAGTVYANVNVHVGGSAAVNAYANNYTSVIGVYGSAPVAGSVTVLADGSAVLAGVLSATYYEGTSSVPFVSGDLSVTLAGSASAAASVGTYDSSNIGAVTLASGIRLTTFGTAAAPVTGTVTIKENAVARHGAALSTSVGTAAVNGDVTLTVQDSAQCGISNFAANGTVSGRFTCNFNGGTFTSPSEYDLTILSTPNGAGTSCDYYFNGGRFTGPLWYLPAGFTGNSRTAYTGKATVHFAGGSFASQPMLTSYTQFGADETFDFSGAGLVNGQIRFSNADPDLTGHVTFSGDLAQGKLTKTSSDSWSYTYTLTNTAFALSDGIAAETTYASMADVLKALNALAATSQSDTFTVRMLANGTDFTAGSAGLSLSLPAGKTVVFKADAAHTAAAVPTAGTGARSNYGGLCITVPETTTLKLGDAAQEGETEETLAARRITYQDYVFLVQGALEINNATLQSHYKNIVQLQNAGTAVLNAGGLAAVPAGASLQMPAVNFADTATGSFTMNGGSIRDIALYYATIPAIGRYSGTPSSAGSFLMTGGEITGNSIVSGFSTSGPIVGGIGTVTITGGSFHDNTANGLVNTGKLTVANCSVYNNTAPTASLMSGEGTTSITASSFYGNTIGSDSINTAFPPCLVRGGNVNTGAVTVTDSNFYNNTYNTSVGLSAPVSLAAAAGSPCVFTNVNIHDNTGFAGSVYVEKYTVLTLGANTVLGAPILLGVDEQNTSDSGYPDGAIRLAAAAGDTFKGCAIRLLRSGSRTEASLLPVIGSTKALIRAADFAAMTDADELTLLQTWTNFSFAGAAVQTSTLGLQTTANACGYVTVVRVQAVFTPGTPAAAYDSTGKALTDWGTLSLTRADGASDSALTHNLTIASEHTYYQYDESAENHLGSVLSGLPTEPGTYMVSVQNSAGSTGLGQYVAGTSYVPFTIQKAALTAAMFTAQSMPYAGKPITDGVLSVSSSYASYLTASDFTLRYENNREAAAADAASAPAVVATAAGSHFTGSVRIPFAITPVPLTVKAANASMTVGDALPALGYTLDGLVGTDTQENTAPLTGAVAVTGAAAADVAEGKYVLHSGSYTLTPQNFTFANYTVAGTTDAALTAAPYTVSAASFTASGASHNGEDGLWYSGDITITANDAAFTRVRIGADGTFADGRAVLSDSDTASGSKDLYFGKPMGENGQYTAVSAPCAFTYKTDTAAPAITVKASSFFRKFVRWLFHDASVQFSVTATDATSGVKTLRYTLVPNGTSAADAVPQTLDPASATITVAPEFAGRIYVIATDDAGNFTVTEAVANGGIVVETTPIAVASVSYPDAVRVPGTFAGDRLSGTVVPSVVITDPEAAGKPASGIFQVEYQVNDGGWLTAYNADTDAEITGVNATIDNVKKSVTASLPLKKADGTDAAVHGLNTVSLRLTDNAGNVAQQSFSFYLYEAPALTVSAQNFTYDGRDAKAHGAVTAVTNSAGSVSLLYQAVDEAGAAVGDPAAAAPADAGTYEVQAAVAQDDDNWYLAASTAFADTSFTVAKAAAPAKMVYGSFVINRAARTAVPYTADLTGQLPALPEGCAYGSPYLSGLNKSGDGSTGIALAASGMALTATMPAQNNAAAGLTPISLTGIISSRNYEDFPYALGVVRLNPTEKMPFALGSSAAPYGLEPQDESDLTLFGMHMASVFYNSFTLENSAPSVIAVNPVAEIITAQAPGTAVLSLAATYDFVPGRKSVLTLTVVPAQVHTLAIDVADASSPVPEGLSASGKTQLTDGQNSTYPVLDLDADKLAASTGVQYQLTVSAADKYGAVLGSPAVTWASSNTAIAAVNAAGVVTVSAAAKPGMAVITATSSDFVKTPARFVLRVRSYTPRLAAAVVTANLLKNNAAQFTLYPQYDASVTSLALYDSAADAAAGTLSQDGTPAVTGDDHAGEVSVVLKRSAAGSTPRANGSYARILRVTTSKGVFDVPFTLRVSNVVPRITVRQAAPFQTFYRNAAASFTITTAEDVTDLALTGLNSGFGFKLLGDTVGAGKNFTIGWLNPDSPSTAAGTALTSGTLNVTLRGYVNPVPVRLNVAVTSAAPRMTLLSDVTRTGVAAVNTVYSSQHYLDTGKLWTGLNVSLSNGEDCSVNNSSILGFTARGFSAHEYSSSGNSSFYAVLDDPAAAPASQTATVKVQLANWTRPLTASIRLNVTSAVPAPVLWDPVLYLNTNYLDSENPFVGYLRKTPIVFTDGSMPESAAIVPLNALAKKYSDSIRIDFENPQLIVSASSGIPAGVYTYTVNTQLAGGTATKPVVLTVRVTNAKPAAAQLRSPALTFCREDTFGGTAASGAVRISIGTDPVVQALYENMSSSDVNFAIAVPDPANPGKFVKSSDITVSPSEDGEELLFQFDREKLKTMLPGTYTNYYLANSIGAPLQRLTVRLTDSVPVLTLKPDSGNRFLLNTTQQVGTTTGTFSFKGITSDYYFSVAGLTVAANTAGVTAEDFKLEVKTGSKLAVSLKNRSIKAGTYRLTASIVINRYASAALVATGSQTVTFPVTVTSAMPAVTIRQSGSIDLARRSSAQLTYTFSFVNMQPADFFSAIILSAPSAENFFVSGSGYNRAGQAYITVQAKENADLHVGTAYPFQFRFSTQAGSQVFDSPTFSVRPIQSTPRLTMNGPAAVTIYQSETAVSLERIITLASPQGVTPLSLAAGNGTSPELLKAVRITSAAGSPLDANQIKAHIAILDASYLVPGKTYKLVLNVLPDGWDTNRPLPAVTLSIRVLARS